MPSRSLKRLGMKHGVGVDTRNDSAWCASESDITRKRWLPLLALIPIKDKGCIVEPRQFDERRQVALIVNVLQTRDNDV